MSKALYKSNPTFVYNYKREGYIPPPIATFNERSSRIVFMQSMSLFPPFAVQYFLVIRFFNYQIQVDERLFFLFAPVKFWDICQYWGVFGVVFYILKWTYFP